MRRMHDAVRWSALLVLVAACGGEGRVAAPTPTPLTQDFPVIVSDAGLASAAQHSAASSDAGSTAYVSIAPGTLPDAPSASIRNPRNGAMVVVPLVAGGFDPVAVPAGAGDILEITVLSGAVTLRSEYLVPIRVHPIVVRTDPPPQKVDVPLNAIIEVVFSEPVDPASLSGSSIQLHSGVVTVPGTYSPAPGRPTTVLVTPTAPLAPGTSYDLTVTPAVRDLTGDPLDAGFVVRFTTVSVGGTIQLVGRVAFTSDRDGSDAIYVTNADGSGVTRLAAGNNPAWSPDGKQIAFVRGIALGGPSQIFVMTADGFNPHFVADGSFPSWSPDGSRIVFNGPSGIQDGGIFVMHADGSGIHKLIGYEFALPDEGYGDGALLLPAWSPDGHSIAFVRANFGIPWMIYIMNADGSAPRLLNLPTAVGDSRFTWSPDGSRLLFQQWKLTDSGLDLQISSADVNGGDLRAYTSGRYVGGPDWSPDGAGVLFEKFTGPGDEISPIGGRMRIFVAGVAGGPERQLIPEANAPARYNYWDHEAAWSRVP